MCSLHKPQRLKAVKEQFLKLSKRRMLWYIQLLNLPLLYRKALLYLFFGNRQLTCCWRNGKAELKNIYRFIITDSEPDFYWNQPSAYKTTDCWFSRASPHSENVQISTKSRLSILCGQVLTRIMNKCWNQRVKWIIFSIWLTERLCLCLCLCLCLLLCSLLKIIFYFSVFGFASASGQFIPKKNICSSIC